jgi:hypothetical protein
MRVLAALPILALLACKSTSADDLDVRIKVRLENQDSHLYDVASVDLDLERDNVVVREHLGGSAGHLLDFPVEVIVKVPIGPGALVVEATPRDQDGQALGGGEGQVTAVRDTVAALTVSLLSDRNRPSRGRMTGPDGGLLEPDATVPDGALDPDAGPGPDVPPAACASHS